MHLFWSKSLCYPDITSPLCNISNRLFKKWQAKKKSPLLIFVPFLFQFTFLPIFLLFLSICPFFLASFFQADQQKFPIEKCQGGWHRAPISPPPLHLLCHWVHKMVTKCIVAKITALIGDWRIAVCRHWLVIGFIMSDAWRHRTILPTRWHLQEKGWWPLLTVFCSLKTGVYYHFHTICSFSRHWYSTSFIMCTVPHQDWFQFCLCSLTCWQRGFYTMWLLYVWDIRY